MTHARRCGWVLALCLLAPLWLGSGPSTDGGPVVLCLGDSLTEGYGVEDAHAYPSVLERRLRERGFASARVINAGINGSTSASAVSRLRWQLRAKPDFLVLALGGNDGLRGLDLAETEKNLSEAITIAQAKGVQVLLAGMQIPPNYGPDYTRRFREIFPRLEERHGVVRIPFLLEGVAADPDLNLPDGIHPNPAGYQIVADNVLSVIAPLL